MTLKNNRASLLCYFTLCASFRTHWWIQTGVTVQKRPIWVKFGHLVIWRMTFKNYRAPLLCYFKLCATFRSHWWIQTGVTVWKCPIWVKFWRFLEPCDFEIWWMTLQNNRSPLLCYFKLCAAFRNHIGEFKIKLQSGNAQFGSKSTIFSAVWPSDFTDDPRKQ